MKFRFSDLLIFALLFIFVAAFPVDLFQIDERYKLIIHISLRLLILGYYIYVCCVNIINIFKFQNLKRALLFVPFLLASFSNLIAYGLDGARSVGISWGGDYLALVIVDHFLIAIVEEFLFRLFIQSALVKVGSIKRIIYGAAIFALFHLLNMVNISSVDGLVNVLIQVAYNFGLGILLGFVYEYTYSLPACILLHFSFNFFNTVLYKYMGCLTSNFAFYMTAVVIALVLVIYTFLIYWFVLRRNDRYFKE